MDIVTLPQKRKSEVEEVQLLTKQADAHDSPTKGERIDEGGQDSFQPQDTAATAQDDQTSITTSEKESLQRVEGQEGKEKSDDLASNETTTELEAVTVAKEQHEVAEGEKEGSAEIEQEVISQDGARGHMDEFIVMDSGGGQYVRPPKRVTLAEYIKRRKVTDSTSSESSQPPSEKEAVFHTTLSATRSERLAALEASAQVEGEGGTQRRSPTTEAISEALKAEIVGLKGQIHLEKRTKDVEKDSAVKSKEATSASEKRPASRQLSPVLPLLALKKVDVHAASEQSKSDTTQANKIPVSSRMTPQQPHRFSSPISTPLPPQPTFPSMLQPHPAAPSHPALSQPAAPSAAAAASWNYGGYSHLFYSQAPGIGPGLTQPQDHWPFGHQFYPSGAAGPQSASPLDFQSSLRSLGFDDVPPPPPSVLRSPDQLLTPRSRSISHSRSRSRSRTRSRSRSRSRTPRSRSRSVSRSLRSVSRSRSRSRSPLVRARSRRSRSQSRSRSHNKSPRRSRGRGVSRSRTPSTPERLTSVVMQQLSEHLSAHLLQTIQVQEDKQKEEFGVQASPSTATMGAQIGSGFKLRSVSSQTRRPVCRVSRGIQCSSRRCGMGIQTDPPNVHSTHSQTHIKKRTVGCQTGSYDVRRKSSSNVFDALLQDSDQDFSEFTEIVEDAKKKFAEAIGLTLDDLSDDESLFDVSSCPENTSSVDIQEEGAQKKEEKKDDEGEGDRDADTSQPMAPSPVISGASNISDGEWSDLEGSPSNNNSRKLSESTTPTWHVSTDGASVPAQLQEVADALQSPTKLKDVAVAEEEPPAKRKSSSTPVLVPPPLKLTTSPSSATSAYSLDCESPLFCSPVSMVISPIAESDIDEILIEEQKRAATEASKEPTEDSEGCSTTDKPPVSVVESDKQSKGWIAVSKDLASSKKAADSSSVKESKQKQRSSTPIDMFGPYLPPDLPQTTAYGPALPPTSNSPEPQQQLDIASSTAAADTPVLEPQTGAGIAPTIADTPAPVYGPPLPPPRTSYDVPLPPTYGPVLPPSISGDDSRSPCKSSDGRVEVQADNDCDGSSEPQVHGEATKDKEEEVMTDSQGVWQIRSISLPPFKMSSSSTPSSNSNSNSGQSTPLISNKSTPLSSPGDDVSKGNEQAAKHHPKSVSPQSVSRIVSSDSSEKLKHDPSTSAKPASDSRKRQLSSGRDSDEQTFKSPRKRKRSRRHDSPNERRSKGQESPKEKRTKKGSSSDDSSDGGGGGSGSGAAASEPKAKSRPDTLTTKKLQEAFDSSSLIDNVHKAASSSPPSSNSRKFGSDPVLFPVKKKPILTAQELLEKVRAKKLHLKSPEETFKPQLGREGQQGSPVSMPLSPGCSIGQGSIVLSPSFTSGLPGRHNSTINIQELMMKFHQHMAAKKNVFQDSSWVHHGVPVPPTTSPFVGPPPPPPRIPPPSLVQPPPPVPPRVPMGIGIGVTSPNVSSISSGDTSTPRAAHEVSKPVADSAVDTATGDGDSEDDIDAQLEAVLDSHITEMRSKSHSPSKFSQHSSSASTKESVSSRASCKPPEALNLEQPVSKGRNSSSPSTISLLSSIGKQSATPTTTSEHFLAAELVQHTSSEESGTVGPAVTTKATVDSHFPTNKLSAKITKAEDTPDKSEDHERTKSEDCADLIVANDQLKQPLASPSIEQPARGNSVLKLESLPTIQEVESVSKTDAKFTIAATPDHPVSIMYQSSVLDPVSPTGLSDDSPVESSGGRTTVEQEYSPEHTMSEHDNDSVAVLETSKVSGVASREGSVSSETENKVEINMEGGRDKARGDLGHVSTEEAISSHCPDPKVSTPESGDAASHQVECSKGTLSELVGPTTQQGRIIKLASYDRVHLDNAANEAKITDTVEEVGSDAIHVDTAPSLDKRDDEDKECQKVVDVESGSTLPRDDGCSSGQPENLPTQRFPAEQDLPVESGSTQPPAAGAVVDISKEQSGAQGQVTHDNVAVVTTFSKSSQDTTDAEVDTNTDTEHQESDQAPLSKESESVQESAVHQPSPLVVEQQNQELEVMTQTEETSGVSQKQEKDVQEVESQPVHEKSTEERKEEEDSRNADSAPLREELNRDLHPAPEEDLRGQGSHDPSPETFRGEGNVEAPELTDVSGEDFVVSRSPSFSPSKLPFSSPTHCKITAAIDEVVSIHTCALPSVGTETSNFELSDIQEGDTMDMEVFTHVKDSLMEEQSFNDASRHSSATGSNWDPFADLSESSPLQSLDVSSESSETQLPLSVKAALETAKGTVSSSVESVFGAITDSSSPPLQSPGLLSDSSERQVSPSAAEFTPEAVDNVESLVTRDALTSVIDDTVSQIKQLSTPDEMDTGSVSKDHEFLEETRVREAESKTTDTKNDDNHNDEILVSHSPTSSCTPLGESQSNDTFIVTEGPSLFESGQTESATISEMKEKAAKVQVAIQESNNVAHEQGGESHETSDTALPFSQQSFFGAENPSLSSTAAKTTATVTVPTELKVTIATNVLSKPKVPPVSGIKSNAPSTTQSTPTTVSLAPPTATHDTPTSMSQASPTGSVQATPTSGTTVSSSSDSVVCLTPISTPDVPTSSTVTSSAKSVTLSLPTALTTPSTIISSSPSSYKASVKSRKPKTRVVPPRSCNANKTSPDDNPSLITGIPVGLAAGAATISSHPTLSSPLKLLPSQPHSPVPTVTAETLVNLLHVLCKSSPNQPVYLTIPTTQQPSTSGQGGCNSTDASSSLAKVPQISTPSSSATSQSSTPSGASSVKPGSILSSPNTGRSHLPTVDGTESSAQPLLDSQKDTPLQQAPLVEVEPLVATAPSSLADQAAAVIIEDNKICSGQKGESPCVSDKDEDLLETTTVSEQNVVESGLSCMEVEATVDSTTDQSLYGIEVSEVDSQPCGQESEQEASLAKVEARSGDEIELSKELTNTDPTSSAPPSCPEEKSDTSVKMHTDQSEACDNIESSSMPIQLNDSESSDMAEGSSIPTKLDHSESPDVVEGGGMQTQLDHSEPPDIAEGSSMQIQLDDSELSNAVESSRIGMIDVIQLPTSEPIQTREDNPVSPPPTVSSIAVSSTSDREEADVRRVDEEQPSPAESPTTCTSTTETREEGERESEALEVPALPVSSAEQEEKSEDSEERESAQAIPETGNELLSNVNCCSNSERASPVLERTVREQETVSPCASTGSLADIIVQNQDEDVVSLPALVIKVPASFVDGAQPAHTNGEDQAVDSSMSSNDVTLSNRTEEEGDTICDDDQASLKRQPSKESSRSSRSPCEEKKRSRIGSRSPLFISLPAHYSSREKRVIKGPSERFRSHPKGKGKGHKCLVVSLPLPLYWRRCQELNSRKLLNKAVESSPLLFTPITPIVSKKHLKGDLLVQDHVENADSAKGKENSLLPPVSLIVSYPLTSLVLSSAQLATKGSNTDKIHTSVSAKMNFAVVEMSSEESSSQILPYSGHGESQEDTQLALRSFTALPGSLVKSNHNQLLLSTPERLSTRRVQIGGNPIGRDGALKSKKSLDFVLEKLSSGKKTLTTCTPRVVEMSDYCPIPATYIDFLSPEDYTCESESSSSPHVVVIGSPQHSEGSGLSTGVASDTVSIKQHSSERDKEKQGIIYYNIVV